MAKSKQEIRVNLEAAFQVATSYHHAADRLLNSVVDEGRAGRDISVPWMMLTAFVCELYIRCVVEVGWRTC